MKWDCFIYGLVSGLVLSILYALYTSSGVATDTWSMVSGVAGVLSFLIALLTLAIALGALDTWKRQNNHQLKLSVVKDMTVAAGEVYRALNMFASNAVNIQSKKGPSGEQSVRLGINTERERFITNARIAFDELDSHFLLFALLHFDGNDEKMPFQMSDYSADIYFVEIDLVLKTDLSYRAKKDAIKSYLDDVFLPLFRAIKGLE